MGGTAPMELMMGPLVWAQSQSGGTNPNSLAPLALRRWFAGMTLSSPQGTPGSHAFVALLAGLGTLFMIAVISQGPRKAISQVFDIPGHFRLLRAAMSRVWMSRRMVASIILFTVISWTGSQAMVFHLDSGRGDLLLLSKARRLGELAVEQGVLAGLTPLRDLAGLGDNLALVLIGTILVFRMAINPEKTGAFGEGDDRQERPRPGWTNLIWGISAVYILYRSVSRAAGAGKLDLPLGGCLIVEAILIPLAMLITDGFLLAWVMTELRNAGLDVTGESRFDPLQAVSLMPGAMLACAVALPSRYIATFVFLAQAHLPTSVSSTLLGDYIRWQLGWGLTDIQAAALVCIGLVGVVAWSRGRIGEAISGYGRLLIREGGHLLVVLAMAVTAGSILAATAYSIVLLLPAQSWVLGAADAYAHFATLPVGLWTLAALIILAERSLPTASRAQPVPQVFSARDETDAGLAEQDVVPALTTPK